MTSTDSLRVAVPKGRLLNDVLATFAAAAFETPSPADLATRKLVFQCAGIEWILVKDCDVAVYVEHGAADVGVAGLDQILEYDGKAHRLVQLPFGACRMSLISLEGRQSCLPANTADDRQDCLSSIRSVATKYPRITRKYLDDRGIDADVVTLGGSVELAAVLELTTHVVDLVQTGDTLRANGLAEDDVVMTIQPWLIAGRDAYRMQTKRIRDLVSRIEESIHATVHR